ncbi:MAG: HAMP domain-containing sensor histidine kinase [Gammaproteobacteria bacterium]
MKVAGRLAIPESAVELAHGIPLFINQVIETLRLEQTGEPTRSRVISGPPDGGAGLSEIGVSAALHGRELFKHGFTFDQVVHAYGDLCQAITDLAVDRGVQIGNGEFRTLNRCLDNGIADAVTEYARQCNSALVAKGLQTFNERLGFLAHEVRNLVYAASLAVAAMKTGSVGLNGATGAALDRAHAGLRSLVDGHLADVRVTAGLPPRHQPLSVADFVAETVLSASLDAKARGCQLRVTNVDKELAVDVDREMLASAVANLLQNAFKFTRFGSEVSLHAYASADRILIEIADHCGGLAPDANRVFLPFTQQGLDRSGLGLGLAICQRSVEANHGSLRVRNLPGHGCIFTIDLPRLEAAITPRLLASGLGNAFVPHLEFREAPQPLPDIH